jgi:integrase
MARTTDRLSDRKVQTAKAGKHKAGMYPDGGGLYLRVTEGKKDEDGTRTLNRYWVFRYASRVPFAGKDKEGKPREGKPGDDRQLGIGPLDTLTLAAARAVARECREQLLAGLDPVEQRKAKKEAAALVVAKKMTFDQCRDAYIAAHRAGWRNVKHAKQWTATLTTYVTPVFGHLPMGAIDTGLVLKVLEPIWPTKSETASRLRGRIEAILDWAKVRGYRGAENPARWKGHLDHLLPAKSKVRKVEHHPALPYGQMGAFMSDLREREIIAAKALQFTILTAARTDEVIGMRRDEIDIAAKLWTVPPGRMKGEREHRVPLSEPALAILHDMTPAGAESVGRKYVFRGAKPGRPLSNMAMLELIRRMNAEREVVGLPKWTDPKQGGREVVPHGFRSSFKDWAAERTSFPREVAEAALAHIDGDETERAYQRGDLFDKRRRLMTAWADYCLKPQASGTVTPLRKEVPA